jgi:hypothetical protein
MEWGMRMIHEISRWGYPFGSVATEVPARGLEKAVWDFGYGLPDIRVQNYWHDRPVVKIAPGIRWLALVDPAKKRVLLVLQSYEPHPADAKVAFDANALGFVPGGTVTDAESERALGPAGPEITIPMAEPYFTRVVRIEP